MIAEKKNVLASAKIGDVVRRAGKPVGVISSWAENGATVRLCTPASTMCGLVASHVTISTPMFESGIWTFERPQK